MKTDWAATEAAGFHDKRSYVRPGGREVLFGVDMQGRREEVWRRDGERCTKCLVPLCIYTVQVHHKIHRGSSGVDRDDRMSNLVSLCSDCHKQEHVRVMPK